MLERTYDLPEERKWIEGRDNWMSDTIQNEIIEKFAHAIQREIVARSSHCRFYGLTADGTTEQFSCSLKYVDSSLEPHTVFWGLYNARDSTGETLFSCIKDIFLRLNIPIERIAGFCFDGAANMSGCFSGVQARLKELNPHSLYVHCSNHSLDLILQEAVREVSLVADTLNFVQGVSFVIRESSKRKQLYKSFFGCDEFAVNILGLCPTRWCIRDMSIKRVTAPYPTLLTTLHELKDDKSVREDSRAKIGGLYKQALKGRTNFGLLCCHALFEPCEAVATSIQSATASAQGTLECTGVLRKQIATLRDDAVVDELIRKVETCASHTSLKMPDTTTPRVSKTPARLRQTREPEEVAHGAQTVDWRRGFFEAIDVISAELDRRFDQASMKLVGKRKRAVFKAAEGRTVNLEALQLPEELDTDRLELQLKMLKPSIAKQLADVTKDRGSKCVTVQDVASCLTKLQPQTRSMFSETEKLIELCLCLPISVASSEHHFLRLASFEDMELSVISIAMEQESMPSDDLAKGGHVENEQGGAKHQAFRETTGDIVSPGFSLSQGYMLYALGDVG
ncbi:hypothetical protein DPEC_G00039950 [Dallia pectoralis]|uniref:Uncharacterized protein n=1 Tax=Dallia pectoralis TaxID=75939 RepID=A0ACC2HF79_DALPE|nr:hypothetical protein DPEC_G00039950 [Dallia pectoralis]